MKKLLERCDYKETI